MTSSYTGAGTLRALAISSESASTSCSERWRNTSPAFSSPRATTSTAAFCGPVSLPSVVATAMASVLAHPLPDLCRDPVGLALDELPEPDHVLGLGARRQRCELARGRAGLELGEAHGLVDLAQPCRVGERLGLLAAQAAPGEEREQQDREAHDAPLERSDEGRGDRPGRRRGGLLGKRDRGLRDGVAALRVDAGG